MNTATIDLQITEMQQLMSDRNKLYAKLTHIGYVPDEDMREYIEAIRRELERRIEDTANELIRIGG